MRKRVNELEQEHNKYERSLKNRFYRYDWLGKRKITPKNGSESKLTSRLKCSKLVINRISICQK